MKEQEARVESPAPLRVDKFIAEVMGCLTRSQLKAREAEILVNGKRAKVSTLVTGGDLVLVRWEDEPSATVEGEDIGLDVIFENDDVMVINKPQGMVVHPANGNWSGTLVNALVGRWGKEFEDSFLPEDDDQPDQPQPGVSRPGIVHRLDKDTSGVLIVAKNPRSLEFLAKQFRNRQAHKRYLAILRGAPKASEGSIDTFLARDPAERKRFAVSPKGEGKHALTDYSVLERFEGYCLMEFRPHTGRTHQLRAHAKHLRCPILGDPVYASPDPRFPGATLMLHAAELCITLPGESEPRLFTSPLPERFEAVLASLRKKAR
jgi:23S rRNA pseudouridine1911/1915/1917 synthase